MANEKKVSAEVTSPAESVVPVAAEPVAESMVVVEFVGTPPYFRHFHGARSISQAEFASIGIESDVQGLRFAPDNGFRQSIPASNKSMVDYFENVDQGFKIV